jgi:ADP-heptose:LPS heptosyltransferase
MADSSPLRFPEIALLAKRSRLYVGNDTGPTHLAAAAGAHTVAIFGPSHPQRYAPFAPNALTLWKPAQVNQAGVVAGTPQNWDWERDGIGVEEAAQRIFEFAPAQTLSR